MTEDKTCAQQKPDVLVSHVRSDTDVAYGFIRPFQIMVDRSEPEVVLLLTHSGDFFTVDRVAEALRRKGARPFRLNTDLFPLEVKLSARLTPDGLRHFIRDGDATLDADRVCAVWTRKMWTPKMDEHLDPKFQDMCIRESTATLQGFLDYFHNVRWINNSQRALAAENKLRQLRVASEVGLIIPRTLTTNDPEQARDFFTELGGRMVAKLLRPLSVSMGADSVFVYTNDVREEDLAEAEMLRHSPMVFQERIPKDIELRIAYVDGVCFVGAIEASGSLKGQTDWRLAGPGECPWIRAEIPHDIETRLRALMSRLGLVYGAIDMIKRPEGEYVFLEVNPGGEWGMLERDLSYPISEALAEALLKKPGGDDDGLDNNQE
jgi:MvdC family ATP-grasp ribosomal peptide maturase